MTIWLGDGWWHWVNPTLLTTQNQTGWALTSGDETHIMEGTITEGQFLLGLWGVLIVFINNWLVVEQPLWKILVNWDDYSQYMGKWASLWWRYNGIYNWNIHHDLIWFFCLKKDLLRRTISPVGDLKSKLAIFYMEACCNYGNLYTPKMGSIFGPFFEVKDQHVL